MTHYGEPRSEYPFERISWDLTIESFPVEIFLVNTETTFWRDTMIFWKYIESHSDELLRYEAIKKEAHGRTMKEYYAQKIIFINEILEKVLKETVDVAM